MSTNEGDGEIVLAFLEESHENLDQLDQDLVSLEADPTNPDLLAQVFRTIHTIKGTCGFLGYQRLEVLTHAGENLLGALRSGDLALSAEITTSLLHLVDAVRSVLAIIEATGDEGNEDHASVIVELDRHLATPITLAAPAAAPERATPPVDAPPVEAPTGEAPAAVASDATVRVDVSLLDKLMDLVGELVLTRNQIGGLTFDDDEGPLAVPYRQLRLLTGELRDGVMQARLQQIGTVTGKLRRIVRDLAADLGKSIRIEIEGEDVGVDKAVNEALRDPLLHLVRNAVDHGIETTAARLAAGKPAEGVIRLRAYHQGGRVHIELSDDGSGIDPERLVEKAIASGHLTATEAAALTSREALFLVFRAGLSTKDEVTNISGRGVGMDVVRSTIEHVGGNIDVESEVGRGSMFRINVPLTLAIMPALVVSSGGVHYAVPQVDIHEILRLTPEEQRTTVDDIDGARVHRLRGRSLPLVDLAHELGVAADPTADTLTVVVVEAGGTRFGLVVDDVVDPIEAVVKPLPRSIRQVPAFAGVTILGDGLPSLILDVAGVAAGAELTLRADEVTHEDRVVESAPPTVLLARAADGSRVAVPLTAVCRLVTFTSDALDRSGGVDVVDHDGGTLPLLHIDGHHAANGESVQAVVCETSAGRVGIVVDGIDDLASSLVVDGLTTELLDIEALVADAGLVRQ